MAHTRLSMASSENRFSVKVCAKLLLGFSAQWRPKGTRTLLFAGDGAGLFSSGPQGGGKKFRALDKKTGKTIFEMELPANETGLPMTFMSHGKQFIVVAVGARNFPAELIGLSLPK